MGIGISDLESEKNFDTFLHRLDRLMYKNKARLVSK